MRDYLCSYYAYRQYEADAFYVWATNQDGDIIGTSYITWLMADFSVMARSLMPVTAGADDVSLTLHVRVYSTTHLAWFTGMMVEPDYGGDILGDFPAYADGDSEGWYGTAHPTTRRAARLTRRPRPCSSTAAQPWFSMTM